jgi:hypothetical protein
MTHYDKSATDFLALGQISDSQRIETLQWLVVQAATDGRTLIAFHAIMFALPENQKLNVHSHCQSIYCEIYSYLYSLRKSSSDLHISLVRWQLESREFNCFLPSSAT